MRAGHIGRLRALPIHAMIREMPKFILITGIDGSGKTTLSKVLTHDLNGRNGGYLYRHANEVPVLMRFVKISIKRLFLRRQNAFTDYGDYVKRKEQISLRHKTLCRLYRLLLLFDYMPQVFFKITLPLWFGRRLVVDRYIYDVVINLGLNIHYSPPQYLEDVELFYRLFPRPDFSVFLDTDEDVAYARKTDIPSIDFLRERRGIYSFLAGKEGMRRVKGDGSPEELADHIMSYFPESEEKK
jgi:thymidylate kinase